MQKQWTGEALDRCGSGSSVKGSGWVTTRNRKGRGRNCLSQDKMGQWGLWLGRIKVWLTDDGSGLWWQGLHCSPRVLEKVGEGTRKSLINTKWWCQVQKLHSSRHYNHPFLNHLWTVATWLSLTGSGKITTQKNNKQGLLPRLEDFASSLRREMVDEDTYPSTEWQPHFQPIVTQRERRFPLHFKIALPRGPYNSWWYHYQMK